MAASRIDILIDRLRSSVERSSLILEAAERQAYSCDGLTSHRAVPKLVIVPASREELIASVRAVIDVDLPWVARGAGTGLSGGALPDEEGVLVVTSRLKAILEVDPISRIAVVEPGVVNLELSKAVLPHGLYFAPDPSSQIACSIGGNVAENSGGAHCFKYGFTTHHVLALELLLPTGELLWLGSEGMDGPGPDLRGVVIGSEGTLGIVTRVVCRLLPLPEARRTFLAYFDSVAAAAEAVSDVVSRGITPAAIEMMDHLAIAACEIATGAGLDTTAQSCLLLELDGEADEVAQEFLSVRALMDLHGSSHVWEAANEEERALMWLARKAAFAAAGRVAPAYIVQDGVVPRSALPRVLEGIGRLGVESGLSILNVFHAGDGNLHPLVTYDPSIEGQEALAEEVAAKILTLCLEEGGSLTGEHGIGVDKVCHMPEMFTADDLTTFERLRGAFDPSGMCNRGKLLPTPRLCGERPGRYQPHPLEEAGLGERW
ncbi:FAD-linked oxidase C-terminal domain-containing protein [Ferrimicrobium sp.]|uniref:FAD-linked oxidase C-terminal domain-containing protein n=1 Tax=Ferrimicrobium sp. TaxID=2926050 RepID=UPI0026385BF4|nr:FAD-linked oxidase C-terminal domain-containing protein [Ferrimicrobium sp.]